MAAFLSSQRHSNISKEAWIYVHSNNMQEIKFAISWEMTKMHKISKEYFSNNCTISFSYQKPFDYVFTALKIDLTKDFVSFLKITAVRLLRMYNLSTIFFIAFYILIHSRYGWGVWLVSHLKVSETCL